MTDHHQSTFSLYWKYQRDTSVFRTLLLLLLSLSFSFVTNAQGQDRIILPEELEIKLDKIIALEEQMIAANFPMVGFEGKQSLSEIREKREEGTLTEEEAEAYVLVVRDIMEAVVVKVMTRDTDYDGDWSYESIRDHLIGPEENTPEEEEEACLAPYPKVIGTMEGESTVTTTESGRIKGEPQTCSNVWYYYLGPIGGYAPIVRGDPESAKAGWYDDFEYRTILREYGMAFAIAVGDVHSPVINSNRRDESSALLVSRFQEDRELSATFERFISRHYGYFSKQAEREFSGSGEVNPVYPVFNVLDILAGGGLSGLKALTRQLARRSWLQGGRQIRRIAPEAPIKVGDDVIEITNQQGEVLFRVMDDDLEITSKAFLPEGEEVVFREQIASELPISSGSGQNLSGQVELVKTKRGNLHVEVVAKTGDDLFSAFGTLNKLSNETKAAISSKGWGDDVLKQLDDDLGSPSSELFRRLDQEVELVNHWNSFKKAGLDDLAKNPVQLQKFDDLVKSNNLGLDAKGLEDLLSARTATKNLPWEHPDKVLDAVKRASDSNIDGVSIKGFPEPADGNTSFILRNAKQYQREASGDAFLSFDKNGVSFDNVGEAGKLIDRKWGHSSIFDDAGNIANQNRANSLLEQANRQLNAADGTPIKWEISTSKGAEDIQDFFELNNIDIEVVHKVQQTIL